MSMYYVVFYLPTYIIENIFHTWESIDFGIISTSCFITSRSSIDPWNLWRITELQNNECLRNHIER